MRGVVFGHEFFGKLWEDLGTVEGLDGFGFPLDMQNRMFRGVPMEILPPHPITDSTFSVTADGGWIFKPSDSDGSP